MTKSPTDALRLLVVEDESATRELLSYLLDKRYVADIVESYDDALARAETDDFDVVLIDISLSDEYTGEDVMKALREQTRTADAAMIACTAYAMPGDREHFLKRGFDSYISKPFTRERLYHVIDDTVAQA
jgi:CheY-like chemotaxis protein